MASAIWLREDYVGDDLRRLARDARDGRQVRRLLALASIYDGNSRTEAARIGGVTLQIVRDWEVRFNAEGPAGLIDWKAPGKAPMLGPAERAALARAVEEGPTPQRDGIVRWRLIDLVQWLWDNFGVSVSETTMGRELRAMRFSKLSARPWHHAQDPEVLEAFKKNFPDRLAEIAQAEAPGKPIEIWFADEARVAYSADRGRRFQAMMGACSTAWWASIPRDRGRSPQPT